MSEDPNDLSDELAKKYDPEKLLKLLAKRAGRGQSLDHDVRAKYEKKFGVDLGHVKIVTGAFADEFNKQRGAYAVTVGRTGMILMGNSPDRSMASAAGQALLAHELTHVAQAKGGLHRAKEGGHGPFAEEHEHEAEAVEHAELTGDDHGHAQAAGNAEAHSAKLGKEKMDEAIEKIKARVMEMAADALAVDLMRNGDAIRRP